MAHRIVNQAYFRRPGARDIYGEEVWRTYAKIAIVRNPWDRIVSMWTTKWWHRSSNLEEGCPLEFFITNLKPHPHRICNSLFYTQILDEKIDFILRFERLQRDFNSMLNSLGFENTPLPHIEKRDHAPYAKAYTEVSKNLVRIIFSKDISHFEYEF